VSQPGKQLYIHFIFVVDDLLKDVFVARRIQPGAIPTGRRASTTAAPAPSHRTG
jgi:hypothetical protein